MTYLKVVFSFLLILFLVSCVEEEIPIEIEYSLHSNSLVLEVNSDITNNGFDDIYVTTSTDETILCTIDDSSVLYDTLGDYSATCTYESNTGTDSKTFTVEIVDTTSPVITSSVIEIVSTVIPSISDLNEVVTITDNYDSELTFTVDSSLVDITIPGSYTLTLFTEDSSGNVGEKDITLTIYNLDIPTYTLSIESITETSIVISYDVTDNVEINDTTFIKMEMKLYNDDVLVETKESTDLDDYIQFIDVYSDHEYEVEVIIHYDLNKGDGEEVVSTTQVVHTLSYDLPTLTIGVTYTTGNSLTMYYTYTDPDLVIEDMILNLYDESDILYTSVLFDNTSNNVVIESLDYDSEFRVEVIVEYDLLDSNGTTNLNVPGNTVNTVVLSINDIIVPTNIINEVQDYTFELDLGYPLGYTIENVYIDDVLVGYTYENNKHLVTIPSSSILEGEATYEITKIVVNNGSVAVDVIPEDNNELIVTLQIPISISEIIINNGRSYLSPLSSYQIKLSLENYSTYDIQAVTVNGIEVTSEDFYISDDVLIISEQAINTYGGFRLSIDNLTYLNGSELITLDIDYIDYLYAGNIYDINYINNRADFLSMGPSGIYILQSDIDLTDIYYLQYLSDFKGCLDGNGYSITGMNLTVDSPDNIYLGLFSTLWSGSLIKNLTLSNMNITSTTANTSSSPLHVGILAGYSFGDVYNVTIESSSITINDLSVRDIKVGGIFGVSNNGMFELIDVDLLTNIQSIYKVYAGGILGYSNNASIIRSYTKGDIIVGTSSDAFLGGISGYVSGSDTIYNEVASILDIEVIADTTTKAYIGGINGIQAAGSTSNMYYIGTLKIVGTLSELYIGGINGWTMSSVLENGYVVATFDLGLNPSLVYAGNITSRLESSSLSNTVTESIYLGTLNDNSNSIIISDIGYISTLSTTSNIHLYELDITQVVGSDYTLVENISVEVDINTFDKFTFYEDTLLFDNVIWDLEYTESSTILKLLNVND